MRLLIISDAWKPQINGVVRTYEHIIDELDHMDVTVDIVGPAEFPLCIGMPGYKEIQLALFPQRRLAKRIRDFNPSSLHIATEGPLGKAARAYAIKNGIPFTTAYHTQFPDYVAKRVAKLIPSLEDWSRTKTRGMIKKFHAPSQAIMVPTQSVAAELEQHVYAAPIKLFTRGVVLEMFYPGEPEHFHDLKRPVALYVGRVAIEKNLEDFLQMDWHGSKVIVGQGPDKEMLARKYPDVHFAGKKEGEELAAHYRSADIFVFPSRTDTFGMVLIEALASGLPVAAYDVTGPKDIVTAPHLGALHEDDLAEAAKIALKLKNNGSPHDLHNHVRENYTWQIVAEQFLKIQNAAESTSSEKKN